MSVTLALGCGGDDEAATDGGAPDAASGAGGTSGAGGSSGAGGTSGAGGSSGAGGTSGDIAIGPLDDAGQVVAPWDALCVATFTEAYDVLHSSDEVVLEIQPGDRYLLGDDSIYDAVLIYITELGAVNLSLFFEEDESGEPAWPFTSSCGSGPADTESVSGVFVDTVVYEDQALTIPLCTLQAGLLAPGLGVERIDQVTDPEAGVVHQVGLNALAEHCDGAATGFVEYSSTMLGGWAYSIERFRTVLGPRTTF